MSSKRNPLIVLSVALIIACAGLPAGAVNARAAQGQIIPLGIVAFQDESGAEVAPDLVGKLARTLQQRLAAAHKDLLPRAIGDEAGAQQAAGALSVEQLAALGKQRGLKFVVRGGVLALNAGDGGGATVAQVYAEVVSVESSELRGVRAEGEGADAGAALNAAIEKLAGEVYGAIISPSGEAASAAPSSSASSESDQSPTTTGADESEATGASDAEATSAAEADEELQQLIAQSESLAASGASNAESLGALNRALEGLKNALAAKAARLEQAQDTAQADAAVSARRQELETAVSRLTEETAAAVETGSASATEEQQPSGEKKKLTTSINDFMSESLSILQKIQEMRSILRGAGEEQTATGDEAGGDASAGVETGEAVSESAPAEEATEEVSGVVTENGEPVEGVEVTEPESGQSAVTGADGSYTLKGVPAGRMSSLVLTKAGAKMATARLDLPRGRAAVADFDLKQRSIASVSPLRVVPSMVIIKAAKAPAGGVGALKGVVRDAKGQPLARALVTLKGIAVARTDSAGRYAFLNVPAGAHQLTIYRSGLRPKTERVQVAAKKSSEARIAFAPADKTNTEVNRPRPIARGAGTLLRGDNRANTNGKQPRPSTPRTDTNGARAGQTEARSAARPVERRATANGVSRTQPTAVVSRSGQLRGVVVDAKTGRPLSGALVSVAGLGNVTTKTDGSFHFPNVAPGTHRIVVRLRGYTDAAATTVVRAGQASTLNLRLIPGAALAPIRIR